MHAIQASFCALQITDNMEKWPKMVAREGLKIHQKSWKVNPGTLQGSSVCIFTQLDHQNASQGHPYDRKRSSGDSNSGVYPAIVRGLQVSTLSGQLNWIVANPAYLQILHSPQVAITRGAGGRGEALGLIENAEIIQHLFMCMQLKSRFTTKSSDRCTTLPDEVKHTPQT